MGGRAEKKKKKKKKRGAWCLKFKIKREKNGGIESIWRLKCYVPYGYWAYAIQTPN